MERARPRSEQQCRNEIMTGGDVDAVGVQARDADPKGQGGF